MSIQCCVGALVSATRDNKTTIVCETCTWDIWKWCFITLLKQSGISDQHFSPENSTKILQRIKATDLCCGSGFIIHEISLLSSRDMPQVKNIAGIYQIWASGSNCYTQNLIVILNLCSKRLSQLFAWICFRMCISSQGQPRTRVFQIGLRFQCYQPTQNHFQNLKSDACTYLYVLVPSTICRSITFTTAKPCFTNTLLKWWPLYYGHFILA